MAEMTIRVSDLSGEQGAETFTFEVDGVKYAIDLTPAETERELAKFAPLIEKSKRVGGRRPAAKGAALPSEASLIREWCEREGIEVPAKGRIPKSLREQYYAAQAGGGE